ncbi:MAG: hypothetical protein H0S85_16850 [Desulfovibrionaceae bacterium]|nr:hypothetical protein [Desulfovibrionaceae bacterium]
MDMISELVHNMGHSTDQGFVGVSMIFIYFAVIFGYAVYRIRKGDHLGHH